ncbi:SPOR domain-containing protein [uncultured Microbacterium sp.]|uniref:SPOR domain-containing protein n=1 Tax=uncultured Microbacterium sp. TaxID=191216 RepID=UPI0025D859B8|nr:SPOR domain-containing protein [uncultured Microbacterium sp.]
MSDTQHDDRYDGEDFGDDKYWFNSKTGQVEHGMLSSSLDRIGPFDTAEEAARAPHVLRERSRLWAEEDAAEDNWGGAGGAQ